MRDEKDVYTLVERGEGDRERDEKSTKNHRKNHRKTTKNRWVKSKKETQLSMRERFKKYKTRQLSIPEHNIFTFRWRTNSLRIDER